MHCLSEVVPRQEKSNFSSFQSELEGQLSQWLLFECKFQGRPPRLAGDRELPEEALKRALSEAADKDKVLLLRSLKLRPFISPSITDLVASLLRPGVPQCLDMTLPGILRRTAVQVLQNQGPLPEEIVKAVAAWLKSKDSKVR